MELSQIIPHIEALIFASEKPLTTLEIVELINNAFGFMEERISPDQVDSCIRGIYEKYQSEFYPFEVRESGGGWQFLTKKEYHKTLAQLNGERFLKRLSTAALETLAIIAYKQPLTKGEIESIRGVNSDYSIQKLLEKELIVITGRNENLPGKPLVYGTSKNFKDYFGINSTDDLPKIKEVLAEQLVEPTIVNPDHTRTNDDESLFSVDSKGDLVMHSEEQSNEETTQNNNASEQNISDAEKTDDQSASLEDEAKRKQNDSSQEEDNANANDKNEN